MATQPHLTPTGSAAPPPRSSHANLTAPAPLLQAINIDSFDVLNKIGEGGFGTVLLVRKKDNGKLYALKVGGALSMCRCSPAPRATSSVPSALSAAGIICPSVQK